MRSFSFEDAVEIVGRERDLYRSPLDRLGDLVDRRERLQEELEVLEALVNQLVRGFVNRGGDINDVL